MHKNTMNSEEESEILRQIQTKFSELSIEHVQNACEDSRWNADTCIEQLSKIKVGVCADQNNLNTSTNKMQGAIRKMSNRQTESVVVPTEKCVRDNNTKNMYCNNLRRQQNEQRVIENIKAGYRVLLLMRGAPGSGKSFLANKIVVESVPLNKRFTKKDFILSTDDYFYNASGHYQYRVEMLSEAHDFNCRIAQQRMANGWSPVIIDNTNMQLWEMKSYVQIALKYGYLIEILEPRTSWSSSAGKLAMKNKHGVPRDKIISMLDRYEKGTVADLLKMVKGVKSTLPLPQFRNQPPMMATQKEIETEETFQLFKNSECSSTILNENNNLRASQTPKTQRYNIRRKKNAEYIEPEQKVNESSIAQSTSSALMPYEKESSVLWGRNTKVISRSNETPKQKSLLDLLRDGMDEKGVHQKSPEFVDRKFKQDPSFQRHSINCINENVEFRTLRQMYSNKTVSGLWDLFVKCNGDINWAVEILLKEDDLSIVEKDDRMTSSFDADIICGCKAKNHDNSEVYNSVSSHPNQLLQSSKTSATKPQRSRQRLTIIESRCVLGDQHYSDYVRKIRDRSDKNILHVDVQPQLTSNSIETQTELCEEEFEEEIKELVEVSLGELLVEQLHELFKSETALSEELPTKSTTNVFIPRALAKELYMLWVEAAYNQIEEKRQQILNDDEQFARLLKNPKYEHYTESPSNTRELLDMEMAWLIYKNEYENEKEDVPPRQRSADLATHITQTKLCEDFPDIPRDTLQDILSAHNNNYSETVVTLRGNMDEKNVLMAQLDKSKLLQRAMDENERLNEQVDSQTEKHNTNKISIYSTPSYDGSVISSKVQPEEARRIALRDFEDTRNMAAHHSQLKAECYQKAKEAIQKGNSAVAVYYSQIANLHCKKIDMYNHRAANCIMDVHKYTQNNEDLLDLHYLYVLEAVGCLDLFLDQHIATLRSTSRLYKHVFIITGRGLHSTGGVSTIKAKVKARLRERNLRWSEANPGLLKVKVFSSSRQSKNN